MTGDRAGDETTLVPKATTSASLPAEQIQRSAVGEPLPSVGTIDIAEYDPAWPRLYRRESDRIRSALGDRALAVEHAGSTAIPGLAAKPKIDILLVVADAANEPAYVPSLEAAGYVLRIREPDWHEHRMFKGPDTDINLHVFSAGSPEVERILLFRDWLRENASDRDLYERTKRDLARKEWSLVQDYADAKTEVVEEIIARARIGEKGSGPA
ncbi:MAG: GrpB family protein [Chloroflexota bacterium]